MEMESLLFRRQYILGPEYVEWLKGWNRTEITPELFLTSHPDLPVITFRDGSKVIAVLGFVLDPLYPERNDEQILRSMSSQMFTTEDLFKMVDTMGGRYVLIGGVGGNLVALNDSAGFRQLFYSKDTLGRVWCAGQPSLISEKCGNQVNPQIRNELFSLPLFTKSVEYWYPDKFTLYEDIFQLLPNHYLELKSAEVKRYWPREEIRPYSFDTCTEYVCSVVRGMVESAINRFDLALALTAGLDSRIILSACRDFPHRLLYFAHTHNNLSDGDPDVVIPSEMLSDLGLSYNLVKHVGCIDPQFENLMYRNVPTARMNKICNSYTMHLFFKKYGRELVVVNGVGGEMTRNFYFVPSSIKLHGALLAKIAFMEKSPLAREAFARWLKEARQVVGHHNHILDLFYWEQRMGSWAAMSYSEYDISFESLSPLNCRKLIEVTMGVKPELRNPPGFKLHKAIISRMWPQLLKWDINPAPNRFRAVLRKFKRSQAHSFLKTVKMLPYSEKIRKV
ncbi:hypothetical protein CHISP_0396 [Chitinispirillum alkaliphilum]|nr:hypothetical protein CHISP_0396 [Chitinispirillum alkaliphilum]